MPESRSKTSRPIRSRVSTTRSPTRSVTIPAESAYLHARWRRSNPLPYQDRPYPPGWCRGSGHYVGTYLAWGVNNTGWWGEGEIKFFLDGDVDWPTICGTGTEDYFGGAWNFEHPQGEYGVYSTPFLGLPQVIRTGWTLPFAATIWDVPLAYPRPDQVQRVHFASQSRHSVGGRNSRDSDAISRCRTISRRPRSGTNPNRTTRFRNWDH